MTTSRKFSLALSYLSSAMDDIFVSSPSGASDLKRIIGLVKSFRERYPSINGKCYNIHR